MTVQEGLFRRRGTRDDPVGRERPVGRADAARSLDECSARITCWVPARRCRRLVEGAAPASVLLYGRRHRQDTLAMLVSLATGAVRGDVGAVGRREGGPRVIDEAGCACATRGGTVLFIDEVQPLLQDPAGRAAGAVEVDVLLSRRRRNRRTRSCRVLSSPGAATASAVRGGRPHPGPACRDRPTWLAGELDLASDAEDHWSPGVGRPRALTGWKRRRAARSTGARRSPWPRGGAVDKASVRTTGTRPALRRDQRVHQVHPRSDVDAALHYLAG